MKRRAAGKCSPKTVGIVGLALFVCAHARAAGSEVHVQVAPESCPNAALLRAELAPLLGAELQLTIDESPPTATSQPAFVRDSGLGYAVEIDGKLREIADEARNCVERARVAAVFIALNLSAAPVPAARPAAPPAQTSLHVGAQLFGAVAYSTEIDAGALGAGVGVSVGIDAFRFAFSASALSPVDIALSPSDGMRGSVALLRLPLIWTAGYLFRAGPLELGPALGLDLDVLRLRGTNLEKPQTQLRINPGALLAFDGRLRLLAGVFAALRLGLSVFPRTYDLSVEPTGRLGRTPSSWIGSTLGVEWQFR